MCCVAAQIDFLAPLMPLKTPFLALNSPVGETLLLQANIISVHWGRCRCVCMRVFFWCVFCSTLGRGAGGWHWRLNDQALWSLCSFPFLPFPVSLPLSLPHIFLQTLVIISLLEWGYLRRRKKEGWRCAQRTMKNPLLRGWREVELHSTCAQSVQCVLKGCGKFKVIWALCCVLANLKWD